MGAFEEAKEYLVESLGMWWPDADEGKLREAASAWRTFADVVNDARGATNTAARDVITHNQGDSVEAFDEFWRRYHHGNKGWLGDLEDSARAMATALDHFADDISGVKSRIDTQLEISAAVIVAGIGLSVLTAGLSSGASVAAAATLTELAGALGVSVSAGVAQIAATTLTGVAFGGIEGITVGLAVAQTLRNAAGLQQGYDLDEAHDAGVAGALFGGAFGAGAGTYQTTKSAGGFKNVLHGVSLNVRGPTWATPHGSWPTGPTKNVLLRQAGAGSSGRGAWKSAEGIGGSARGKTLRAPNDRHYLKNVKHSSAKARNSVILPGYERAVDRDIAEIASGRAEFKGKEQVYEINGRTYGVESHGTVYPASGPGIIPLDRVEYDALKHIIRADGDMGALENTFRQNPKFSGNPHAVEKAFEIFRNHC